MPAKIIGDITWVPQPGYPELTGEAGNEKITAKFVGSYAMLSGKLPEYGSVFYDERYSFFNTFDNLQLSSRSVKTMAGGQHAEITLVYSVAGSGQFDETGVMMEYEYQAIEKEVGINTKSGYKMIWNHRLIAKNGITQSPGWTNTATEKEMSKDDSEKYKWVKPDDQTPDGWYDLAVNIKKAETYAFYPCEVTMTKRSVDRKKLEGYAKEDGKRHTPGDTFGVTGGEWLQGASSIRREGALWVLRVPYRHSLVVDHDLYD